MKTTIILLLSVAALVTACKKDDTDPGGSNNSTRLIEGIWYHDSTTWPGASSKGKGYEFSAAKDSICYYRLDFNRDGDAKKYYISSERLFIEMRKIVVGYDTAITRDTSYYWKDAGAITFDNNGNNLSFGGFKYYRAK